MLARRRDPHPRQFVHHCDAPRRTRGLADRLRLVRGHQSMTLSSRPCARRSWVPHRLRDRAHVRRRRDGPRLVRGRQRAGQGTHVHRLHRRGLAGRPGWVGTRPSMRRAAAGGLPGAVNAAPDRFCAILAGVPFGRAYTILDLTRHHQQSGVRKSASPRAPCSTRDEPLHAVRGRPMALLPAIAATTSSTTRVEFA